MTDDTKNTARRQKSKEHAKNQTARKVHQRVAERRVRPKKEKKKKHTQTTRAAAARLRSK